MNITEIQGWLGQFEIEIIKDGKVVERDSFKNMIMTKTLNIIRDALYGTVTADELELKYVALGADDGTVLSLSGSNTTLGDERFRKLFSKKEVVGDGAIKSTVNIASNEAVFNIREIGIFAGPNATSTLDSGTLISRVFYSRDKTNMESINIIRTDTISRG